MSQFFNTSSDYNSREIYGLKTTNSAEQNYNIIKKAVDNDDGTWYISYPGTYVINQVITLDTNEIVLLKNVAVTLANGMTALLGNVKDETTYLSRAEGNTFYISRTDANNLYYSRAEANVAFANSVFYTKDEANTLFYSKVQSNVAFITGINANTFFYNKDTSNSLFLTIANASISYFDKTNANALFLSQTNANALYFTKPQSNTLYFTKDEANTLFYNKAQANAAFVANVTYWDDLLIPAFGINPAGSLAPPASNTTFGWLDFDPAIINIVSLQVQMPHAWRAGTALHPHIHWMKTSTGVGNVSWRMEYRWVPINGVMDSGWTESIVNTPISSTPDTNTIHKHLITEFTEIISPDKKLSDILIVIISRYANTANDSYGGTAAFLGFDVHYEIDRLGSTQEYIK